MPLKIHVLQRANPCCYMVSCRDEAVPKMGKQIAAAAPSSLLTMVPPTSEVTATFVPQKPTPATSLPSSSRPMDQHHKITHKNHIPTIMILQSRHDAMPPDDSQSLSTAINANGARQEEKRFRRNTQILIVSWHIILAWFILALPQRTHHPLMRPLLQSHPSLLYFPFIQSTQVAGHPCKGS